MEMHNYEVVNLAQKIIDETKEKKENPAFVRGEQAFLHAVLWVVLHHPRAHEHIQEAEKEGRAPKMLDLMRAEGITYDAMELALTIGRNEQGKTYKDIMYSWADTYSDLDPFGDNSFQAFMLMSPDLRGQIAASAFIRLRKHKLNIRNEITATK